MKHILTLINCTLFYICLASFAQAQSENIVTKIETPGILTYDAKHNQTYVNPESGISITVADFEANNGKPFFVLLCTNGPLATCRVQFHYNADNTSFNDGNKLYWETTNNGETYYTTITGSKNNPGAKSFQVTLITSKQKPKNAFKITSIYCG